MPADTITPDMAASFPQFIWMWVNHPANADLVNGSFECVGAVAAWMNVYVYLKHRALKGVFWPNTLFYSAWGLWNLIYYSALSQPISFYAGIALTSGSGLWVLLVAYDKLKAKYRGSPPALATAD